MSTNVSKSKQTRKRPSKKQRQRRPRNADITSRDSTASQRRFAQSEETVRQARVRANNSALGPDSRDPNTTTGVKASNIDTAQEMIQRADIPIDFKSLSGPAIAVLSDAYTQGFQSSMDEVGHPEYPYAAWVFLVKILENAVLGQNTNLTAGPRWLKFLYDALLPKKVPFKAGEVAYAWRYTPNDANYAAVQPLAPYAVNPQRQMNFLFSQSTSTDGWDNLGGNASLPSPEAQLAGYNALITHMSSRPGVSQYMWERIDFVKPSIFARNVSSFAFTSKLMGSGQGPTGYWLGAAYLEVPITNPLFCVFAGQSIADRGFNATRVVAGDSIYLGKRLCSADSDIELRNKTHLHAKPVDFYKLAHVLFRVVAAAFQQLYNDNSYGGAKPVDTGMSIQDAVVLLQQGLMGSFANTQSGVQGIIYRYENQNVSQPFRPFVVGPGTASVSNVQMTVPRFMLENVRALQGLKTMDRRNPRTKQVDPGSPQYHIPVLGAIPGYRLNPSDYTYNNGTTDVPIFGVYPADYIELTTGASSGNFLSLNMSPKLQKLQGDWNLLMSTLARYMTGTGILDGELGIGALQMITLTRYSQYDDTLTHPEPVHVRGSLKIYKTKLRDGETVGFPLVSSQQPLSKSAWDQIQSTWIAPEFQVFPVEPPSGVVKGSTVRTYMGEPYAIHLNEITAGHAFAQSFDDLVAKYVSMCVVPWGTPPSDISVALKKLAEEGNGGFLMDLVHAFAPVAGQVAGGVIRGVLPMNARVNRPMMLGRAVTE
jgi:hypothetical protein